MNGYIALLLGVAIVLDLALIGAWWVQKVTGQSGWIDAIWSYSIGVAGALFALWPIGPVTTRQALVAVLVGIWSLRLGTHVARRTMKGGDDPRYARLKKDWGEVAQRKMFGFLQLQALAAFILGVAVLVAARAPRPGPDWQDSVGAFLLLGSIAGEAIADGQLARFSRDPANKGKVCDVGLWRWSRHPNYFFEWLGWVAYPVIAVSAGYVWGWLAFIGPIYMYYLLVHVSGVPPLEEHMLRSRPDAFRAYQRRTNLFFPGPQKAA